MRKVWIPLALALATLFGSEVVAQPVVLPAVTAEPQATAYGTSPALTLTRAQQIALERNPAISAARREIEAAEGALTQARTYQNPTLSVELEDFRAGDRTTTFTLSQTIERSGKRAARITASERAVDVARGQLDQQRVQLQADVAEAFFSALITQERVRLAEASLEIARSGSRATEQRVKAGKISPMEATRARVAEANVRLESTQAKGELLTQLEALRAMLGGASDVDVLEGSGLTPPRLPEVRELESRIEQAPALRSARLEVRRLAALAELESAKRKLDPSVSVGLQRGQRDGRTIAMVGVSIPFPVLDQNLGNITEALRRRDRAEEEARGVELRVRADLAIARQRLSVARTEVDAVTSEILPGAQSTYDAAVLGFEAGKFEYLDVLDAQRTLLQARSQYLRSLSEAHRAVSDATRVLGDIDFQP